jgi:hypothetical protein
VDPYPPIPNHFYLANTGNLTESFYADVAIVDAGLDPAVSRKPLANRLGILYSTYSTMIDESNSIAKSFCLHHVVRRQQNRPAIEAKFANQLPEFTRSDWIHT